MPVISYKTSDGRRPLLSLLLAGGLLILGVAGVGVLFGMGLRVRPAHFPGIGVGTNVGSGNSLGLNLVVESTERLPFTWGAELAFAIYGFWAYVGLILVLLLAAPVEWALRRREWEGAAN